MAKHIQHRTTRKSGHVFTNEELVLGEIGVNIGSGTLSTLDDDGNVFEFINKEKINTLVEDSKTEINEQIENLDNRIKSIEGGNLNLDLSPYATKESVETNLSELQAEIDEDIENINKEITSIKTTATTSLSVLNNRINNVETNINKANQDITGLNDTIAALEEKHNSDKSEILAKIGIAEDKTVAELINETKAELEEADTTFQSETNTKIGELNDKNSELQTALATENAERIAENAAIRKEITENNNVLEKHIDDVETLVSTLVGEDDNTSVRDIVIDELTNQLVNADAAEAYNTLEEMSAWLKSHPENAATMEANIQANTNAISVETNERKNADKNINDNIESLRTVVTTNENTASKNFTEIDGRLDEVENELERTTRIIESSEEPSEEYRNDYIWLQDDELDMPDEDEAVADIREMQKAIAELTKIVQRHEYAFSNRMNCGTVTDNNSARETMMAEAVPEPVEGFFDSTPILLGKLRNEPISKITNYYLATNLSYGVTYENEGWKDVVMSFDNENNYLWYYIQVVYQSGYTTKIDSPKLILAYDNIRVLDTFTNYYALYDTENGYPENIDDNYSTQIPEYDETKPYLWCYVKPEYLPNTLEDKPDYENYEGANVKHLIIKSSKTEQEIRDNINNILNNELVWCEGNNGLYIKSKNRLVKINGSTSFTPDNDDDNNNENEEIMTGITFINDGVGAIDFISSNGTKYTMKVNNEGELSVYNTNLDTPHSAPTGDASETDDKWVRGLFLPKLYINSVYCSGENDKNGNEINEHSMNPCSHNFVELSNLTDKDINLNGLSLQYASNGNDWEVLPLWGIIKAGSTFLIRGAQCSVMDSNTTVIKVTDYDMEWKTSNDSLIKFNNKSAKFYLTYDTNKCDVENPYKKETDGTIKVRYGYIDLVGLSDGSNNPGGQEKTSYPYLNSNRLFKKYYAMDNVSQATKALNKRDNKSDWYYVDLTRNDILPNVEYYTPRASSYGKNIFYDKTPLNKMKPTIATITFGIQATDKEDGKGATRCFNWVSKGYYDEFLWYRKKGTTTWVCRESFKNLNGNYNKYYNRIQQEASNGEVFTCHKIIINGLTKGTYEYICGKALKDGNPNIDACIDIREFTVRANSELTQNFSFIQVSDQQGFNWDEYQVWKYAAQCIVEKEEIKPHFLINTGDMTQNGNRLNEWIDYFDAKSSLNNLEEMATIGNNDLCKVNVYELGDGSANTKINFANINFFYTFEIDEENPPVFKDGSTLLGYIPSLYSFNYGDVHFICLNSEISAKTETDVLGTNKTGIIYSKIKEWCETDIAKYSNYKWKIAYCHEMPFTIITDATMSDFYNTTNKTENPLNSNRGGSRMNVVTEKINEYWFSEFCQNNDIRLVMGGHKHTQAISWPIKENVSYDESGKRTVISMKPIIQVTEEDLMNAFDGSTKLITINDGSELNGQSFPNAWFNNSVQENSTATRADIINSTIEANCHFCTFEKVNNITAPIYSMSQATGYKQKSNNELPGKNIPWCRHYYPNAEGKANSGQLHPFYSVYTITPENITINVRRVTNIMNENGEFNINQEGENIKNGLTTMKIDNGLNSSGFNHTNNVIIKK